MKTIIIILLLLMLFGGLVTFLSIRKKMSRNIKKARFQTQKMDKETRENHKNLRQDNE